MPFFKYVVKNPQGDTIKGQIEAQTVEQAASVLHNRSLLVIHLHAAKDGPFGFLQSALFGVKQDEIVNFTRQLATMSSAGLTLTQALSILQQQSRAQMQKIVGELQKEIEGGSTFAKALESQGKIFSPIYIQLVRAGETGGVLTEVLNRLADNLEKEKEFRAKTRGALIYPVIVIVTMIIVGVIMMAFVVPRLTQMYKDLGVKLPLITQILINFASFVAGYWWLLLAIIAVGAVAFQRWVQTKEGRLKYDTFLLKVPIMGEIRTKVLLTEFCRTMSLLLSAGISVLQVLEIISKALDNMLYRNAIEEAYRQVEKGVTLSQVMSRYEFFPPILIQMLSVGEETGKLDEVMLKLSLYFEAESEHAVKNLTTAFEPIVMVILGVGVGILVLAIILPIYNLQASF